MRGPSTIVVDGGRIVSVTAGFQPATGQLIDLPDLAALWPVCGFASGEEATSAFYLGYPMEERDPYLAQWLARVIGPQ